MITTMYKRHLHYTGKKASPFLKSQAMENWTTKAGSCDLRWFVSTLCSMHTYHADIMYRNPSKFEQQSARQWWEVLFILQTVWWFIHYPARPKQNKGWNRIPEMSTGTKMNLGFCLELEKRKEKKNIASSLCLVLKMKVQRRSPLLLSSFAFTFNYMVFPFLFLSKTKHEVFENEFSVIFSSWNQTKENH